MAKLILSPERLAHAHVMELLGMTHDQIGKEFGVNRSTVTFALRKRKTHLPGLSENLARDRALLVFKRIQRVAEEAADRELVKIAAELFAERA